MASFDSLQIYTLLKLQKCSEKIVPMCKTALAIFFLFCLRYSLAFYFLCIFILPAWIDVCVRLEFSLNQHNSQSIFEMPVFLFLLLFNSQRSMLTMIFSMYKKTHRMGKINNIFRWNWWKDSKQSYGKLWGIIIYIHVYTLTPCVWKSGNWHEHRFHCVWTWTHNMTGCEILSSLLPSS